MSAQKEKISDYSGNKQQHQDDENILEKKAREFTNLK